MPTDPAIILAGHTPPPVAPINPIEAQGQAAQVVSLQAMAQERVQAARDQSAFNQAMQATNGDPDASIQWMNQNGFASGATNYAKTIAEQRKTLSDAATAALGRQEKEYGIASSVIGAIDPSNPDSYAAGRNALLGMAGQDPRTAQFLSQIMPQNPQASDIPGIIQRVQQIGVTADQQRQAYQKAQDLAANGSLSKGLATALAYSDPTQRQDVINHFRAQYGPGTMSTVEAPFLSNLNADQDTILKIGGARKLVPVSGVGLVNEDAIGSPGQGQTGTGGQGAANPVVVPEPVNSQSKDVLLNGAPSVVNFNPRTGIYTDGKGNDVTAKVRPIPPASVQVMNMTQGSEGERDLAAAIANYQVPFPSTRSMTSPAGESLMTAIKAVNPNYDATNFTARQRLATAFTSGSQGQALNSLNTAIEHLDRFSQMATALDNGNFKPGNAVYNWAQTQFGNSAPTNFDGMKTIMSGELATAFKKSGATDAEIAGVQSAISSSNSPKQLQDYIKSVAMPSLMDKAGTYGQQFRQVPGNENSTFSPYTPDALTALSRHGLTPSASATGAAGGAAPNALQTKTLTSGPNAGRTIQQQPDGTWKIIR